MADKIRVILVNEADPGNPLTLPRNPSMLHDDQTPEYDTQNTPDKAHFQALTYKNSGPRKFGFTITLLPEIDTGEEITRIMVFLFNLMKPTNFDGRVEPPDVTFIYGAMSRRGKLMKRPVTYDLLNEGGVAREIRIDVEIQSYVRGVPTAAATATGATAPGAGGGGVGGAGASDYDRQLQQQNEAFLNAERKATVLRLRGPTSAGIDPN